MKGGKAMCHWILITLLCISLIGSQISGLAANKEWSAEEKLAKQIKPAVVRIVAGYSAAWTILINNRYEKYTVVYGGTGSGAIISPDGYVVTNAHVVDLCTHDNNTKVQNLAKVLAAQIAKNYNVSIEVAWNYVVGSIKNRTASLSDISNISKVITPGGEELPFDLKEIGSSALENGKDVAVVKIEGRNFPTVRLGDSDKIRTGERIFVAGYPGVADLGSLASEKSVLEWSWAPGSISSDKKSSAQGNPLIQINAEGIKPGNSGGPVLNTDGQVIGLLTFGASGGPHWAMASRTVQEFIRKSGASNQESLIDKTYQQGLEFYWQGYYTKALMKFEEVRRLYPKHSEIDSLIAECQNNITTGNDKRYWPDYYPNMTATVVFIFLILSATTFALFKRRKLSGEKFTNDDNH
ncbi:MAG: serine protease [Firmicutes bacterium]|nr:serine protease [Bacillota bacterium]